MTTSNELVSVIIPCYNQAHFLGDAIESALQQDYPHFEVIVVDDGSTDETLEVAARYAAVHTTRQEHQGTSVARNRGVRESKGHFLVFLDSDDRLLPSALEVGVKCLLDQPECGFVFGHYQEIAADGSLLSTPSAAGIENDHYRQLLLSCYVHSPSTAMFRRTVFETVKGFDPFVTGCEDYELYLRITRDFPVYSHGELVAQYRRHAGSMTCNGAIMLKGSLGVLREQLGAVRGNKVWEDACRAGIKHSRRMWGERLASQVWSRMKAGKEWKRSLQDVIVLLRYGPEVFALQLGRKLWRTLGAARNPEKSSSA